MITNNENNNKDDNAVSCENENKVTSSRRNFIFGTVAAAGATIAPGMMLYQTANAARSLDKPASSNVRWGMLVDTTKDVDWNKCVEACNKEHGLGNETESRDDQKTQYIRVVDVKNKGTGYSMSLPVMCQHCESAPCVDVCPTGASMKREDGIVLVDRHRCIGCRYCMMACPYKARSFVHETLTNQAESTPRGKGCVESCNMCVNRIDKGLQPACVEASDGGIIFGDLNDAESPISKILAKQGGKQIRADLKLNTGVYYQGI
ncbi:sulfate reduction electron transfer complex DsrMKJOP subunit DsrO [sulfur-oxidizing endosymbiont of Gigantopelta aegis]|uniref:sulfate reduction electron transfer complex DsrMKJOP subunit DsrO n=1 Tax=sulfur-oxidizing endosymbiont of Gigantopelta aegis TaxID=2794934 RepID=UPI0018DB4D07|nr:4Fe-4S dicluster domain-containing protein [sulfur-oxidizing endosymbiont of Gigantopelta aegis]